MNRLPGDEAATARDEVQGRLPSNIFVQFLAGPRDVRRGLFGWLLRAIGWVTLVIGPVILLMLIQIKFLPFHSKCVTWLHRFALLFDLTLVWWLWRSVLSSREPVGPSKPPSWAWMVLGLALSFAVLLFSWVIATFPSEWQEAFLEEWDKPRIAVSLHDRIFNLPFNNFTGRRNSLLSNTLVLPHFSIYEGLKIDDPKKVAWRKYTFVAGHRDLRGAIFDGALLPRVNFTDVQLQGASLTSAELQGASLDSAHLLGAQLDDARLQGASLDLAELQVTQLKRAQLQGASLKNAHAEGASLESAQLQGATLDSAHLEGASLKYAQLQGGSLYQTALDGASLDSVGLEGAYLDQARLLGASLQGAHLDSADLSEALLWRSQGEGAHVTRLKPRRGDSAWQQVEPPFDDQAYNKLLNRMEPLPPGDLKHQALERLATLDPKCLPSPELEKEWRVLLEEKQAKDEEYRVALKETLNKLICSADRNAAYALRSIGKLSNDRMVNNRILATGSEASKLIDDIMSPECLVHDQLTADDRLDLQRLKREAEAKMPGG